MRERLKERHDSIGLLSTTRRRFSGMSPLARSNTGGGVNPPPRHVSTANMATSPIGQSGHVVGVNPTTTVVVTAAAKSSSPRLSPVHGPPTHSALGGSGSTGRALGSTSTCGTSPDHSLCPIFSSTTTPASAATAVTTTSSHPASPEMGRSASPLGGASVVIGGTLLSTSSSLGIGADGDVNITQQQQQQQAPPLLPAVTVVPELATLGVGRHRRRSRPSVSPERVVIGSGSPSTSSRHTRLRRQSTTLDEGWFGSIVFIFSSSSSSCCCCCYGKRQRAQGAEKERAELS